MVNWIKENAKIFIGIFSSLYILVETLSFFKISTFISNDIKGLIYLVGITLIIMLVLKVIYIFQNEDDDYRVKNLKKKIQNRIGTQTSNRKPDKDLIDKNHEIFLLQRDDYLDYKTRNYMSQRRISGKNLSKTSSAFLKYRESTDSKTSAQDLFLEAFDLKTGKKLKIEFDEQQEKVYEHKFKIFFTVPLSVGEEFDIVFFLKIPDELAQLNVEDEIMSISLNRYKRKVHELKFSIFLNYEPESRDMFLLKDNGEISLLSEKSELIDNSNENFLELLHDSFLSQLNNIELKSRVTLEVKNPKKETYIIYYKK